MSDNYLTSLNDLVYDWPMGFAKFRIEVLYPNRGRLTDEELAAVTEALGHPLRQILVHVCRHCRVYMWIWFVPCWVCRGGTHRGREP
jgi:hypothetical protein